MYTLTYESIAVGSPSISDMETILEQASANNVKNNITGCLIYYNGGFIQILEGKKEEVLLVYSKIKADSRHTDVHLFSDDEIKERTFPNWGMSYLIINENSGNKVEVNRLKSNILLLSELSEQTNTTVLLFWRRIKLLLNNSNKQII